MLLRADHCNSPCTAAALEGLVSDATAQPRHNAKQLLLLTTASLAYCFLVNIWLLH